LRGTSCVARKLIHPKRKTIGIRVPDHPIVQALIEQLGQPLMTTTLILPGETEPMSDAHEIRQRLEHDVDLVIDGGSGGLEPSTVLNLADDRVEIVRRGRGPVDFLESA
jgi:tRNA threonylcarbamoyl adenosine modification protein (Sua5/YciO/YrdC/YwlC family)